MIAAAQWSIRIWVFSMEVAHSNTAKIFLALFFIPW